MVNPHIKESMLSHLGIAKELAPLFTDRGGNNYHHLYNFLYSSFSSGISPFVLKGMQESVDYLLKGIESKKAFYILGDKDADGVCSITILKNYLSRLGCPIFYNCPQNKETYGSSERILQDIKEKKEELYCVITVDMGIKERELSLVLKEWGVGLVVTDHHHLPLELPDTPFIINPHLNPSHFIPLCGGAVALKLVQGLFLANSAPYKNYTQVLILHYQSKNDTLFYTGLFSHIFAPFDKQYSLDTQNPSHFQKALKETKTLCLSKVTMTYLKNSKYAPLLEGLSIIDLDDIKKSMELSPNQKPFTFSPSYPTYSIFCFLLEYLQTFVLGVEKELSLEIQYAGIATLCDRMPLNHPENRALVRSAFTLFIKDKNNPLYTLLSSPPSNLEDFTLQTVPMQLGPLLNAGGRLGQADRILDFLCKENSSKEHIIFLNRERRKKQTLGLQEVEAFLKIEECDQNEKPFIFYASENIHKGVTGIIANKLCKSYEKPVFILSIDRELQRVTGSARSSFDVYPILQNKEESLFLAFGGHARACGFTLDIHNLKEFEFYLSSISWEDVKHNTKKGEEEKLYFLEEKHLKEEFFSTLKLLPPYGEGNPLPFFKVQEKIEDFKVFGKQNNHLKWFYGPFQKNEFIFWDALSKNPLEYYQNLKEPTIIFSIMKDSYLGKYNCFVQSIIP